MTTYDWKKERMMNWRPAKTEKPDNEPLDFGPPPIDDETTWDDEAPQSPESGDGTSNLEVEHGSG